MHTLLFNFTQKLMENPYGSVTLIFSVLGTS